MEKEASADPADGLAPLLALLGLSSVPDDPAAVIKAYKRALRKRPSAVHELRHAAEALKTAESRAAYLEAAAAPAEPGAPLAIGRWSLPISSCGAPSRANVPAYGSASARGRRPTMEDEVSVGAPICGAHMFALLCPIHRPTEPTEAARLAKAGAEVSSTGRCGGLAVSRAFGDAELKARPAHVPGHVSGTSR
ncbi:hypothetical protein EMIHUDRAFT_229815 [Emiliania huxleyi CCMP1516]|uniref:PPM-type phosphatase domain-containing protein n=2 Tax=Emiliania huxleyi TaxID=2903 RepID=A0A0D3KCF8_EMIH1|nr:hypothetical protein EMIHUDRAFT_229815 [Emiliania huxleyi CCMP1516]EOD33443.1 hypothetical protein EMIHUDRAFT_229815 [Emiliania huxleyi CCMP1516]|eukprot:XP_005785872.1 hypothetical protein EMIHUDRAFT_229815 [Emiliania huxleyi CCMP1516]